MSERKPQFSQLQEQFNQGFYKGHEVSATALVERSDGSIDTAQVFNGSNIDGRSTVYLGPNEDVFALQKTIDTEKLGDEHQQELARKLAGKALKGEVQVDTLPNPIVKSDVENEAIDLSKPPEVWKKIDWNKLEWKYLSEEEREYARSNGFTPHGYSPR